MSQSVVLKLLRRFHVDELKIVLNEWSALRLRPDWIPESAKRFRDLLEKPSGKKLFISASIKMLHKQKITLEELVELDLTYVMMRRRTRKWGTLQFTAIPGKSFKKRFTPEQFRARLAAELSNYRYQITVLVRAHTDGTFYTCVYVEDGKLGYYPPNAVVFVHHPNTDHVCYSGGKVVHRSHMAQVLVRIFNCQSVVRIDLNGYCVRSLLQISISKNAPQSLTLDLPGSRGGSNPLIPGSRKRKHSDIEDGEDNYCSQIISENKEQKLRIKEYVSRKFGDGPQPTLETVEYQMSTYFHDGGNAPNMAPNKLFRCNVQFSGPNVLAGIRKLSEAGLAPLPMKKHVAEIRRLGINKIVLKRKARDNVAD